MELATEEGTNMKCPTCRQEEHEGFGWPFAFIVAVIALTWLVSERGWPWC